MLDLHLYTTRVGIEVGLMDDEFFGYTKDSPIRPEEAIFHVSVSLVSWNIDSSSDGFIRLKRNVTPLKKRGDPNGYWS